MDITNKEALAKARAEVARLEIEAKTRPFTTDVQHEINFSNKSVEMIYDALGGHHDHDAGNGWGGPRFKVIEAIKNRLAAIERAIFTADTDDTRTVNDRLAAVEGAVFVEDYAETTAVRYRSSEIAAAAEKAVNDRLAALEGAVRALGEAQSADDLSDEANLNAPAIDRVSIIFGLAEALIGMDVNFDPVKLIEAVDAMDLRPVVRPESDGSTARRLYASEALSGHIRQNVLRANEVRS